MGRTNVDMAKQVSRETPYHNQFGIDKPSGLVTYLNSRRCLPNKKTYVNYHKSLKGLYKYGLAASSKQMSEGDLMSTL